MFAAITFLYNSYKVFYVVFAVIISDVLFIVDGFCVVGTTQFTAAYLIICCGRYSRPLAVQTGAREDGRDESCD
jgi:L-2-hydroxyglutarate oxidase LhgO